MLFRSVLKVWQTIGNSQDLPIVENLVAGKSLAKGNPEVLQAALECLPILKALVEQQKPSETYLRASSEPENLLIPAGAPDETDTELLLRPSDNPNHASG